MKNKILIIATGISSLLFSCRKSFFDVNNNPNQPSSVTVDQVLPNALNQTAVTMNGAGYTDFTNLWMGYWSISGGYAPDIVSVSYSFSNAYFQAFWSNTYNNLNDYSYIKNTAHANGQNFYEGIARIMMAYNFENLVDVYGDIPYSQALNINKYPNPKYDKGVDVYGDLFKQIDTAQQLISTATSAPPVNVDIIYGGGDLAHSQLLWQKFANTLKLRMLLRMTEISKPTYYAGELALVQADPNGFIGPNEGAYANPGYSSATDAKVSPFYFGYGFNAANSPQTNNGLYRANSYAVNFYKNTNDPRLGRFYAQNGSGGYAGNDYGIQGASNAAVSGFGPGLLNSPSQNAVIFSDFESLFLQSEAAERGMITGDYKALFKSAVTQSFVYIGVPDAVNAAQTYYSQSNAGIVNEVNIDATSDPIYTIMKQKWAAENSLNGLQAWSDYRRLHIPPDVPGSLYPNAGAIPNRLYYPLSEYQTNPGAVKAQGSDNIYGKVFWQP